MNKIALKNFATSARKELLKKIEARSLKLGITADLIKKADLESSDAIFIDGKQLSREEQIQRNKLIDRIKQIGFERVMEEVAYTWFNRFTALRFMEVNDYLPTKVRALSSTHADSADPDMIKESLSLDLDLDKEYVYELKMNNNTEGLFKYLIIKHCNDLNRYMPFMFETIDDYTEILFPEGLLATDSCIRQMTNTEVIPEDSWEKVEIIGWLYQYYIAEEKDRVIKAKKKYKKEEIPFATQLFTPEWIVRYMVQNSLGRYWVESHPEYRGLIENWEFYLENPNPQTELEEQLARYVNKELKVEDIKCFDPAMGSGHILIYMFDVLAEIYSKCGYMEREIPRLIIENNLYGLDIDDRAYQLASFSIIMKALQYNRRFLRSIERDGLKLNLASIQETNGLTDEEIAYVAGTNVGERFDKIKTFLEQFKDAKTIGSLIKVEPFDKEFIKKRIQEMRDNPSEDLFEFEVKDRMLELLQKSLHQAIIMEQKYDVLITNPPYAGNKYLIAEVSSYLAKNYPNVKADLYSAFIEYSFHSTKQNGHIGFITPFVWMFISSFERIRKKIVEEKNISSLVQLEYNGFEAAMVPVCLFTMRNYQVKIPGEYIKLSDFTGIENQQTKTLEAVKNPSVYYRYSFYQENFRKIPGSPIAYWVSDSLIKTFSYGSLSHSAEPKSGLSTTDNERFLRLWHEVNMKNVSFQVGDVKETIVNEKRWYPYNKGGSFRKWYGNRFYFVNWYKNGLEIKEAAKGASGGRIVNPEYYFKESITWSSLSSGELSVRYSEKGFIFDSKGSSCFSNEYLKYLLGFLNSKVAMVYLRILSPTLDFNPGSVGKIPTILSPSKILEVEKIVDENIKKSKTDWDSFEGSWDFIQHPLINHKQDGPNIETVFKKWESNTDTRFDELKKNEEELNRIFIEIYGLQKELTPEVEEKDVTVRKADLERDIKSFISYAVGCSFGRYSLDDKGLIFAGGEFDHSRYKTYPADKDNILPILPGSYFEDDIVSRFIDFVKVTFGSESLAENLDFIADAIGRKKGETAKETLRRYFLNDFYKDHVHTYKRRPIYWLLTSGKEKAFNCLIYMHRYDKTTLSRIRTDYLHDYQIRLDAKKKDLLNIIEGDSTAKEISNSKRELKSLDKKIDELKAYDELLHHMADMQIEIDLDDGVKVNYEKFKGLVAKI